MTFDLQQFAAPRARRDAPSSGAPAVRSKPSFRQAAARHINGNAYTRAFTPGQSLYITLNRQGYLSNLIVNAALVVTVGTVDAGSDLPDYATLNNLFPTMAIKTPQGDYIHTYSSRSLLEFDHRLYDATLPATYKGFTQVGLLDPTFTGINVASATAQNININYEMPISMNTGLNFDVGLIMRQVANNDFTLVLGCAQASDLYGNSALAGTGGHFTITSITGTVFIEEDWFEAVNSNLVDPPDFHTIVKLRDQLYGPLILGDNYISYSLGPTLLDGLHRVITNNAAVAGSETQIAYIKMLINKQVEIQNRRGIDIRRDNFYAKRKTFPPAVFHLDFFDDASVVNVTRARDFINSNLASQLDTVINIINGTTLTNSGVNSTYRELVTLGA